TELRWQVPFEAVGSTLRLLVRSPDGTTITRVELNEKTEHGWAAPMLVHLEAGGNRRERYFHILPEDEFKAIFEELGTEDEEPTNLTATINVPFGYGVSDLVVGTTALTAPSLKLQRNRF